MEIIKKKKETLIVCIFCGWQFQLAPKTTRRKLRNGKVENSLHSLERSLIEDISLIKSECDFMLQQMQDLKNQISQVTHQISIIEICSVSEKSKIESHLQNINAHKQGFDAMYARERKISELHTKELEHKQQAEEEIERQKLAKVLETNEHKGIQTAAVESECEAIERECNVLTKRNKAIMLKLRRKLVDAEETRRRLMTLNGLPVVPSCDDN